MKNLKKLKQHGSTLTLSDFDFDLPKRFIAQSPADVRHLSKLLVYDSSRDLIFHRTFFDILEYLSADDVLVFNKSRVLKSRILHGGNEIFILKGHGQGLYNCLVRPGKKFKEGSVLIFDELKITVMDVLTGGTRLLKFESLSGLSVLKIIDNLAELPLPPYITNRNFDMERYQTVYADTGGSRAAPTAGLHFSKELLSALRANGVNMEYIDLDVGLGTFSPVKSEKIFDHVMHAEDYEIGVGVSSRLNKFLVDEKRLIAVGTTSVRTLESNYVHGSGFKAGRFSTDIFIFPGRYKWKTVNALITNFHLPKSTLLMLVASFLENKGVENPVDKLFQIYEIAKANNYRFFSFGDAMFII